MGFSKPSCLLPIASSSFLLKCSSQRLCELPHPFPWPVQKITALSTSVKLIFLVWLVFWLIKNWQVVIAPHVDKHSLCVSLLLSCLALLQTLTLVYVSSFKILLSVHQLHVWVLQMWDIGRQPGLVFLLPMGLFPVWQSSQSPYQSSQDR